MTRRHFLIEQIERRVRLLRFHTGRSRRRDIEIALHFVGRLCRLRETTVLAIGSHVTRVLREGELWFREGWSQELRTEGVFAEVGGH